MTTWIRVMSVVAVKRTILVLFALVFGYFVFLLLIALPIFETGVPLEVFSTSSSGRRIVVTQTPNGGVEGHRLRIYVEDDGWWDEYFVEYDAVFSYWGSVVATHDAVLAIRLNGFDVATLDLSEKRLLLKSGDTREPVCRVRAPLHPRDGGVKGDGCN